MDLQLPLNITQGSKASQDSSRCGEKKRVPGLRSALGARPDAGDAESENPTTTKREISMIAAQSRGRKRSKRGSRRQLATGTH